MSVVARRTTTPALAHGAPETAGVDAGGLNERHRRALEETPGSRSTLEAEQISTLTIALGHSLPGSFLNQLSVSQHQALAQAWSYRFVPPGGEVCLPEHECQSFFVVLTGVVGVNEASLRSVEQCPGEAIGHYPLCLEQAKQARK